MAVVQFTGSLWSVHSSLLNFEYILIIDFFSKLHICRMIYTCSVFSEIYRLERAHSHISIAEMCFRRVSFALRELVLCT